MPTGSPEPELAVSLQRASSVLPCEAVPYLLSTADALFILLASLLGCFAYHWMSDTPVPDLSAYFALGLFASFIHIARLSGRGYYDFENAAKPGVEIVQVAISWLGTGLILTFFAFLFKVGESFSRGSFLIFLIAAPIALLAERKLVKSLLNRAVARGAVGRRDIVLVGDRKELDSLGPRDLLALFFGAGEVHRFVLSTDADPLVRKTSDAKTLDSVAGFVRAKDAKEILLALPWNDSDRMDLV